MFMQLNIFSLNLVLIFWLQSINFYYIYRKTLLLIAIVADVVEVVVVVVAILIAITADVVVVVVDVIN